MLVARRLLVVLLAALPIWHGLSGNPEPSEPSVAPTVLLDTPGGIWQAPPDLGLAVLEADHQARLAEEARLEAERVESERLAAEEAARLAARQIPSANPRSSGPHTDAWWWGVAICEQGGRNDPYFGYFSFMDGSSGGKTWAEQVEMGNALLARAGREIGPWAESCVRAGYAASPSG